MDSIIWILEAVMARYGAHRKEGSFSNHLIRRHVYSEHFIYEEAEGRGCMIWKNVLSKIKDKASAQMSSRIRL